MTQRSVLCCALSVSNIVPLLQLISVRLLRGTVSFTETVTLLNTTEQMPPERATICITVWLPLT